jgi:hypothetical protein
MDYLKQLQDMASEIETKEPYKGHFYKVSDIATILAAGLLCNLKTAREIIAFP